MKRSYILGIGAALAMAAYSAPDADSAAAAGAEEIAKKSIVPAKYGNKYKNGGSDALATFINDQCSGKEGFEYPAFFTLCRKNGLDETKVAHYEGLVAEKAHGSQGRARMTLRNMLATIARKDGKLVGLDGNETAIDLPKPALTGAAAAAKEAAEQAPASDEDGEVQEDGDENRVEDGEDA